MLGRGIDGPHHWVDLARHADANRRWGPWSSDPSPGSSTPTPTTSTPYIPAHLDDDTVVVVLDLEAVPVIDVTATEMLVDLDAELIAAPAPAS